MPLPTNSIVTGDCFEVLDDLPEGSVHAVVTDPPYFLGDSGFMSRDWDDFSDSRQYQEWCREWAELCRRVLKPGGHLLAFGGNTRHHRLFTGVEDAGFEIRDTLTWHYGSGFPKASDISKTIDKRKYQFDHDISEFQDYIQERREDKGLSTRDVAEHFADEGQEPTGCVWNWENEQLPDWENYNQLKEILDLDDRFDELMLKEAADREVIETRHDSGNRDIEILTGDGQDYEVTNPELDLAKKWDGWKTGLKPATEFVVMARKPYDGAIVEGVLEHGTGALNIDACRVGGDVDTTRPDGPNNPEIYGPQTNGDRGSNTGGRYPANVVFDETAADALDAEVGVTKSKSGGKSTGFSGDVYGDNSDEYADNEQERIGYDGEGGPSRYFYTSKASRSERTEGGAIENDHPTVKPIDLMEWLIKLVTREGQVVLDPFAGSGTTCKAAKALNREFIGIERQAKYADVARVRCGLSPDDPSVVREDGQGGLDEW